MKKIILICSTVALLMNYATKTAPYGSADTSAATTQIPPATHPLIEHWMRDTYITLGIDSFYYMIGTTADPNRKFVGQTHCWDWNDGLYLFRSKDLSHWDSIGLIWSLDNCGTWQGEPKIFAEGEKYSEKSINGDPLDNRFRAVWAPELHYIKSQKNWFIVACMNNSAAGQGSFILRSMSGKPEGPYENIAANAEQAIFNNIDGSLFEDEDGATYFVGHNHFIARMKSDMSGFAEPIKRLKETPYKKEPYIEGAFIFKHDNKYHLVQAIWSHRLPSGAETYCPDNDDNNTRYSYDCIVSTADNIYGPYSQRYNAITGGGHNNFFRDKTGKWWATVFFNPRGAQAKEYQQTCRPGIVPMKYAGGKFFPDNAAHLAEEVVITINLKKSKKVSSVEYGFHYEEIGMIGEGGLHAELVRNRSFEEAEPPAGLAIKDGLYQDVPDPKGNNKKVFHVDPLIGWTTTPFSYSPIHIERTKNNPMNDKNPSSMLVHVTDDFESAQTNVAIHNSGFFGMCFRKGNVYRLSFYMRGMRYKGNIKLRLSDENGQPISKALEFQATGNEWQGFSGELVADKDAQRGMLSIVPTAAGTFQLDVVSLFPADTWDNGKSIFRRDIMQNLVDYAPDFIRFPGGCIVHGANEETMYHWKQTIGDIAQRPGAWSKWAPYYRSDGLGYHEFYELCEYLGADAMYVAPTGMVCTEWAEKTGYHQFKQLDNDVEYYVNDVLDAIEYAIGDTTSVWGRERAKNGHPKPFPLKYVEIGNEDFGPEYYKRYDRIASAIKAKYPQIKLICNSIIFGEENDKRKYMAEYPHPDKIEIYDEHYYQNVNWVKSDHYKFDSYQRPSPDLFIGELGIQDKYPKGMLAEGVVKLSVERNGDLHPLMADRPLMRNFDFLQGRPMQPVLLHDVASSIKTFNYYLCKMLRDNKLNAVYETKIKEQKDIFATAGFDEQTKEIIVKIINLSDEDTPISIEGIAGNKTVIETFLTADARQINTPLTPDAVSPRVEKKKINFPAKITLKSNSFIVYRMKK